MGEKPGTDARTIRTGSREPGKVRFSSEPGIAPMSARELLHYDAAMAIAEERYPLLPADVPEWEQRLRVRLRMAYHAVILDGWSDHEHHRRTGEIHEQLARASYSLNRDDAGSARVEFPTDDFEALVIRAIRS